MTTESVTTPTRTRYVGRSVPSRSADVVVTGELEYLTDISLPGMLYGRVIRAKVAHGRLLGLETEAARQVPGVVAVLTAADVPNNVSGAIVVDQPVLVDGLIRHSAMPSRSLRPIHLQRRRLPLPRSNST